MSDLRFDHLDNNARLRMLAAGAPTPLPNGMLDAALASGQSAGDFALALADIAVAARSVAAYDAECAARANAIINSDAAPSVARSADPAVELAARRILEA